MKRILAAAMLLFVSEISMAGVGDVEGNIDGYYMQGSQLVLSGWACVVGHSASIDVHVYKDGAYGSGTWFNYGTANLASEPSISTTCQTSGVNHRFKIPISGSDMLNDGGSPLYVHGINPNSGINLLIANSGRFSVPDRVVTALPSPMTSAAGDGTTNDTAALNAALALGGVTYIPDTGSPYLVENKLVVVSDSEVLLDGTIRLMDNATTCPQGGCTEAQQFGVLQIENDTSNVLIGGRGTIDGNSDNQTECCIGGVVGGGPELANYDANISNVTIRELNIINSFQWPVNLDGTDGALLYGLNIVNGGASVAFSHGTTNAVASYLSIDGIDPDIGFGFYNGVTNSSIDHSVIRNTTGAGICVLSDDAVPASVPVAPGSDITIEYNEVYATNGGISTENNKAIATGTFENVVVRYNTVHGNALFGLGIGNCEDCTFSDNYSYANGNGAGYVPGIYLWSSKDVTISNNLIKNEGQGTTTGRAVTVDKIWRPNVSISGISILDNMIVDDQTPGTMEDQLTYTIYVATTNPLTLWNGVTVTGNTACGIQASVGVCNATPNH